MFVSVLAYSILCIIDTWLVLSCVVSAAVYRLDAVALHSFGTQVLINFTMGLVGALVAFLWQIWGLISSYQVDHGMSCSSASPIACTTLPYEDSVGVVVVLLVAAAAAAAAKVEVVGPVWIVKSSV
jgi:hypothetical protein